MSARQFIVRRSAIETRWDPFYFQPHLVALEARVRAKTQRTLRDYTLHMAGGSTPLKSEGDKHYAQAETGVPFIRVQNLTTTGELDLQDVKYITESTHSKLLERSRLTGGELLVKITGVGRMAVAAVVPMGVDANINQHIAAIRTKNKQTSEALAAYLNLDFVEQLASRRATGGTRPALDYTALLSIPVIEDDRIVKKMQFAYIEKRRLEKEAASLLVSVDAVLLKHLGITLPHPSSDALSERIFTTRWSGVSQGRWDSAYQLPTDIAYEQAIFCGKFPVQLLGKFSEFSSELWDINKEFTTEVPYLEISDINLSTGDFNSPQTIPSSEAPSRAKMMVRTGDILISTTRPSRGAIAMADINHIPLFVASTGFSILREVNTALIDKTYLFHLLRSEIVLKQMARRSSGGNYPAITQNEIEKIAIPLPTLPIQKTIVAEIQALQGQATKLRLQAQKKLDTAKAQVESMIFGES